MVRLTLFSHVTSLMSASDSSRTVRGDRGRTLEPVRAEMNLRVTRDLNHRRPGATRARMRLSGSHVLVFVLNLLHVTRESRPRGKTKRRSPCDEP